MIVILIVFLTLSLLMLAYLRIANHYDIIDKPNERSSHDRVTIRGGGIIVVVAVILWWILGGFQYPLFFAGFLIISIVSFIDDINNLPNRIRISIQFLAVVLLLLQITSMVVTDQAIPKPMVGVFTLMVGVFTPMVGVFTSMVGVFTSMVGVFTSMVGVFTNHPHHPFIWLSLPIILGFINAYNFMDGINGITVTNSLVTLGTLFYLNLDIRFMDPELLLYGGMGLLVFGFFNFREKAACFAGDVGAVSVAFLIAFALASLIAQIENYYFIALVLVYGVDSAGTIIERLIKKENIFQAHRSHLYQLMANQSGMSHVAVSLIYGAVQLIINVIIIYAILNGNDPLIVFCAVFILLVAIFAFAKIKLYRVFD